MRTPKEKEKIILELKSRGIGYKKLAKEHGISYTLLYGWMKKYAAEGIKGLESKTGTKKGERKGRPKKAETDEEELRQENIKLRIEIERLKKGYSVKGVGGKKEYVTIKDANTK
jgi:transposase-like protein